MRLEDIMETEVETVTASESADVAWERMRLYRIHHLVVLEDGKIVGVLSNRDLNGPEGETIRPNLRVGDVMSTPVVTAEPDMTVKDAANLLRGRTIGCLPVMKNNRLIGIITMSDLLELMGKGFDRASIQTERRSVRGLPPHLR